jgi:hypothetical protein
VLHAAISDSPFLDRLTLSGMAHVGSKKAQRRAARRALEKNPSSS